MDAFPKALFNHGHLRTHIKLTGVDISTMCNIQLRPSAIHSKYVLGINLLSSILHYPA